MEVELKRTHSTLFVRRYILVIYILRDQVPLSAEPGDTCSTMSLQSYQQWAKSLFLSFSFLLVKTELRVTAFTDTEYDKMFKNNKRS